MGITESKMLVVKLATACSVAEQNGEAQVQHVLSDEQVGWGYLKSISYLI
jgi:hypothetical protein